MAEQTFRSPGFFEQEIDLSQRQQNPLGTPAGVIGTAEKGPAFVPVTVGSFADFETKFGTLDPDRFGPYAVREYLRFKDAVSYTRVLGAGANRTIAHFNNTNIYGVVQNAGFKVKSTAASSAMASSSNGSVQFITAKHYLSASTEGVGYPLFTDNVSYPDISGRTKPEVNLVRGVILNSTGSRCFIVSSSMILNEAAITSVTIGDGKSLYRANPTTTGPTAADYQTFKFIVSSSAGSSFGNDDGLAGLRIYSASLNPASKNYIGKVLNTSPDLFQEEQHLLYLDYAVEDELATVSTDSESICLTSGSATVNSVGLGDSWLDSFGRFDTRYTTPRTTSFISQPFGRKEFDLFHFESLSDGAYSNEKLKISISNLVASTDPAYEYGTFNVELRKIDDLDADVQTIEVFPNLSLDPESDRFIAKQIGDMSVRFDFDAEDADERRLVLKGKHANRSANIRVVVSKEVLDKEIPASALPFGFKGIPVLKTTDTLTDVHTGISSYGTAVTATDLFNDRITTPSSSSSAQLTSLTGSIVPPLPFRVKVTTGPTKTGGLTRGEVGAREILNPNYYWGVVTTRIPVSSSYSSDGILTPALNPNVGTSFNNLINAYTKFNGIQKLENLATGSGAGLFNNNKFTLAKVALSNTETNLSTLTGSANEHMIEAAYIRNGEPDPTDYTITDPIASARNRITLATLVQSSSIKFNRFTSFAKFTNLFYGGFDGLNILDKDCSLMNDRASSLDTGGKAGTSITGGLGLDGTDDATMMGSKRSNNVISSYQAAIDIMTDEVATNSNLLAIPGIREPLITDHAARSIKDYSMAMYVMDIQHYDEDASRLFIDSSGRSNPRETAEQFESRNVDNNYSATYYPDVFITDPVNNQNVRVPSSVVALGALGYNDQVAYPWFAPAGFNRGALGSVVNAETRLTTSDRDNLYDARINPIANFPQGGFVIFGQKTMQRAKSALDRVNVRRMLLEVKRLIKQIAERLLFEPNNQQTRSRFTGQVTPILALIQAQQGIEKFSVVCDSSNNSQADVEQNRMNGRIVVVPTRSIEFIAIDFIITNAGVEFV